MRQPAGRRWQAAAPAPSAAGDVWYDTNRSSAVETGPFRLPGGVRPTEGRQPSRLQGAFSALRHRNFRLFFAGQAVSLVGTWMQNVGQGWLVLQLSNSPWVVGTVTALQFLPFLIFSLVAGALVDRLSKRGLLVATQSLLGLLALALGLLTLSGRVRVWHVALLAFLTGTVQSFDNPGRQAFIVEMVGREDLMNAISLNSSVFNGARLIGPAVAGLVIGRAGVGWAFVINAASFLAVIAGLLLMRLERPAQVPVHASLVKEVVGGLEYVRKTPLVLVTTLLIGVISTFALNFNVLMPVFVRFTLGSGPETLGYLMSALGTGALSGALVLAYLSRRGPRRELLLGGGLVFSLGVTLLGTLHRFATAFALLLVTGFAMIIYTATSNSTIQVTVPNQLRGRVMSLYVMVLNGVAPLGSLFVGWLAQRWNAGAGFLVGGAVSLAAVLAAVALRRRWDPDLRPVPAVGGSRARGGVA
ncbi:MAG: MFS transporter [Bacillota bacterium]|nr:MFS transporter [Bacillota bacterium]